MTDTTDIKALREQWETLHERLDLDIFITTALTALEAERQRADDAHKYGSERDAENESLMLTVGRLRVEIAELKGDQVPVAITDDMAIVFHTATTDSALGQDDMEEIKAGLRAVQELFTVPQKSVAVIQFSKHRKLPDGSKPDWNEMPKVVSCNWIPDGTYNVYLHPQRPVNLENVGYVQVDEGTFYLDELGVHAAIEAAGGSVKDGE